MLIVASERHTGSTTPKRCQKLNNLTELTATEVSLVYEPDGLIVMTVGDIRLLAVD